MNAKKFTRGFFYVLGTLIALAAIYGFAILIISDWYNNWRTYLILAGFLAFWGLVFLARWAFDDEWWYRERKK